MNVIGTGNVKNCISMGWIVVISFFNLGLVFGHEYSQSPNSKPQSVQVDGDKKKADPFAKWEKAISQFEAADKKSFPKTEHVLFIGSSSIRGWNLEDSFPGKKFINRGFGGSEISDSIHFASRIIIPYKPKLIFLYAGDNDIAKGKSAERVVSDYRKFVETIHSKLPKTRIAFIAIKPSIKRWSMVAEMRSANRKILEHSKTNELLDFVDIDSPTIGPDQKPMPEIFKKDGLHLNAKGYKIWTKAVSRVLSETNQ